MGTGNVTAWIRSTKNRVDEIIRRAAQGKNENFKTKIYVPKMARQRKADIDKILLDVKKDIKDLRYIIRNGQRDLNVLLRRGNIGKYQSYPIEKLGSVAPLDPKQRNQITASPSKFEEENDGFRKILPSKQSLYRQA